MLQTEIRTTKRSIMSYESYERQFKNDSMCSVQPLFLSKKEIQNLLSYNLYCKSHRTFMGHVSTTVQNISFPHSMVKHFPLGGAVIINNTAKLSFCHLSL